MRRQGMGECCSHSDALVVVGVVPLCQADRIDDRTMMLLAGCAGADRAGAPGGDGEAPDGDAPEGDAPPPLVVRATSCEHAFRFAEEVRHGHF